MPLACASIASACRVVANTFVSFPLVAVTAATTASAISACGMRPRCCRIFTNRASSLRPYLSATDLRSAKNCIVKPRGGKPP